MEAEIVEIVRRALDEDAADQDVTTLATVEPDAYGSARLLAKESCVVAGFDAFAMSFTLLDPDVVIVRRTGDGEYAEAGTTVAIVEGKLRAILSAERTALNFIQRLSGIATLTRRFVKAAEPVDILDTRKTTPGLRVLEKAAVRAGGGVNHRANLGAAVLIKDNHIAAAGGIREAVERARKEDPGWAIEVECESLEHIREALDAGADELLLDNMSVDRIREAVSLVGGSARIEASGGITLDTVSEIAATGVDAISVGALTHSAPSIDFSLEVEVG